jgi:LysR family glycine cleavage system transcriptional activator
MKRLPPLNAVRTFEVAARLASFAAAGKELGVSAAAVSQQVRHLETYFGKKLFVRNGNRLSLTDAGLAIFPQTSRALDDIAAMTVRLLEGEMRTRLIVSVPFSLAEVWLAPKLAALLESYPQLSVDVRVEDDPVDLARHDVDIRVSYGDYHYPSLEAIPLLHDQVVPLCAPELWYRHGNSDFDCSFTPSGGPTMRLTQRGATGTQARWDRQRQTPRWGVARVCRVCPSRWRSWAAALPWARNSSHRRTWRRAG